MRWRALGNAIARLSFLDIARSIEHSRLTRSTFDFSYESTTSVTERATYLVFDSSEDGLHTVALPPRPMEMESDRSAQVDGQASPTVPASVIQRLAVGFARRVGLREASVVAVGRLLEGGGVLPSSAEVRTPDVQEALTGLGKLDQADVEVRALSLLIRQAGEGHYFPFVYLRGREGKSVREVTLVRQRHQPIRLAGYLRAAAFGQHPVSKEIYLTQGHASHIYVRPPPGTVVGPCELPAHWRHAPVESVPRGRVWYIHVKQRAKPEIAGARARAKVERGDPAWNARTAFLLPPTPHVLLGFVFLLLSAGSLWLAAHADASTTQKLLSLDALAGSIALPILWGYRDNDIATLHVGGQAVILGILAGVWLTSSSTSGVDPVTATATFSAGLALGLIQIALALWAARESLK